MKKYLITILLLFPFQANASVAVYKSCNHHKFTYLFMRVYDVYLCVDDEQYFEPKKIYNTNFSLIINYNMNFDRGELAKSSIEEISRYYEVENKTLNSYYDKLFNIFPNVSKKDTIEAKYYQEGFLNFYHNNNIVGSIEDPEFSKIFLDIWLYKDNKHKGMTKDLFANE